MNWGKGIVLGLACFMGFVIFLVIMMFKSNEDGFDKDYYEKGLAYDIEYQRLQQVVDDNAKPKISFKDSELVINYLAVDSGKVIFFRPSDMTLDKSFLLSNKEVVLNSEEFVKGEWKVRSQWHANGKDYVDEQNIFIQ